MTDDNSHGKPSDASYRSGVAARLAGIPVETLRVWERRYGVVSPRLSPRGQRLYSTDEVRRLALIKQLLDLGHPIGSVATLPTQTLATMREGARMLAAESGGDDMRALRIALVGPIVSSRRLENAFSRDAASTTVNRELNIVGRCMNAHDAADTLRTITADIVVIELPTLNDASIATVASVKGYCDARHAIVLYRFAPNAIIRRLREAGHEVVRAPSDAAEIAALCRAVLRLPTAQQRSAQKRIDSEPPPPRFDERALVTLADSSTTVYCECPRHLVDLLLSLTSFERYSAECANRGPDDAALHRDLQQTAGRARVLMEEALLRVAAVEGLPLPRTGAA